MFIQSQTSDVEIISDDVSLHRARTIFNIEGFSGVLKTGRRFWAEKDVVTLGGETTPDQFAI